MGIGVALGVALGLPLGLAINGAMGDAGSGTAIGPAMGVAIGVAIGAALEQRHKGETRPLTSYEKRARRWMTWVGIAVLALLAAVAVTRRGGVAAAVSGWSCLTYGRFRRMTPPSAARGRFDLSKQRVE